jgi:uncharacterized membrane protein
MTAPALSSVPYPFHPAHRLCHSSLPLFLQGLTGHIWTNAKTMDTVFPYILTGHVAAGFASLLLFFIPMFARKGGKLHSQVGKWYTYTMWAVVVSAILLCIIRFYQGHYVMALFLSFLALLTSRPLYYAIAILKHKQARSVKLLRTDFILRLALSIYSPILIGFGLGLWGPGGHALLTVFGTIGAVTSIPSIIQDLRGHKTDYNWLADHISGMIVSAIAAFTAFFSFGGRNIFGDAFDGNLVVFVWLAPTFIGVAIAQYHKRKLKLKKKADVGPGLVFTTPN